MLTPETVHAAPCTSGRASSEMALTFYGSARDALRDWRLKAPSSSEAVPVMRNYLCRDVQVAKAIAWQFMQKRTAWFIGDCFNIVAPEDGVCLNSELS